MTITPDLLEAELTLVSATARVEFLVRRQAASPSQNVAGEDDFWFQVDAVGSGLDRPEALELVALAEVIARKLAETRAVGVEAALRAGAGWDEIAAAAAVDPGTAWDRHDGWVRAQAEAHRRGQAGLDDASATAAHALAGPRPR
ncbi:hypothetical protein GB931_00490 [Modestobacter sp. I12A-02628]|uniref:Uncharacterized protein n=2 Tax=Goekera deserti TaxID=2497753 RepID=A0A7K3WIC3_9ACTN|nr:hypothetical protein [Goekera deserti]MPQ96425.1 hypothetical protein [Goekera deserti]NDI47262.1 hypothetical protein [Goekera deserti]NEL56092.1 hypothetical protein [Goekera deserti]